MDYQSYAKGLIQRLKTKGYSLLEPRAPLDFALIKHGALLQTYVVGVYPPFGGTNSPNEVLQLTRDWFYSMYKNNGSGLLLFAYYQAPPWAIEQIKNFSGQVGGGVIDLNSSWQWVTGSLGWDQEVGAA